MRFSARLLSAVARSRSFYVTTPIFYVNAAPHLGHVYSAVVADAVARFEQLVAPDCRIVFSSGTDEHGSKIQQAAAKHDQPLPRYCDAISAQYQELFRECDVCYTDFVRTTEDRHKKAVQHFWNELVKRDWVYKAQYTGWYSVSDETFVQDNQLRDEIRNGRSVKVFVESGHPVEWTEESNYMFRLSAFRQPLQEWLLKDGVVTPEKYLKQLRDMLASDAYLSDISISRPASRVHWAVRVPGDEEQSVYVWLDALVGYLTACGYPELGREPLWPADLHVIGKDILKFHGVYWPAFLMAVGLHPPRRLLCHAHWTVDAQKMSKSLGNVVEPRSVPGGLDALRYFLLREGTMHSDANYSETKLIRVVNSELADTLGNLLSRCTGAALNPLGRLPPPHAAAHAALAADPRAARLLAQLADLPGECERHYSQYRFHRAADAVMSTLRAAHGLFEASAPWRAGPAAPETAALLRVTLETLRACGVLLQPLAPRLAAALLDRLAAPPHERRWLDACEAARGGGGDAPPSRPLAPPPPARAHLFPRVPPPSAAPAPTAAARAS